MLPPLISIIVPTLNQAAFIEQTLASIVDQGWPRLELIVIDGGSTDGTRAIVERFGAQVTRFVSEPDGGQAEAINKGMRLATGDILAWLNSDDYYLPQTLARAVAALGDTTQPRLVYGGCRLLFEADGRVKDVRAEAFDRDRLATCDFIYQASAFWTRELWKRTGELNESQHFTLDWDWWLRASAHGELIPLDEILSVYRFHPAHKTGSGSARRAQEIVALVEKYAEPGWAAAFRAVAAKLGRLEKTWRWCAGRRGLWTLHRLVHLDLYSRYGDKIDRAFSQLSVLSSYR
jgi:glycosyltransferase involved in cell wall biosynthesis